MFGHVAESVFNTRNVRLQNVPTSITQLVGREQQEKAACTLLLRPDVRLLTLTGTGGIGKTRLSHRIGSNLLELFANGVCFVPLASINDFELVIPTITHTLGVRDGVPLSIHERLKAFLHDKHLLLILDNFEQVLPAAPLLTDLLASCPHIKILVTSRAVLRLQGEHEFPVQLLTVPDLEALPPPEELSQYTAIALFVRRVQAFKHDFQLTADNARVIAEICVRLDGLPLALELAAARIKLLSPDALLTRLDHQLAVLTFRKQDAPLRQQTLRNTITWSYNLLTSVEQALFRRLSIFVGSFTLETAEAVCNVTGALPITVLDGVTSLLDKNLLQRIEEEEGHEPRISMLTMIREYGLEALEASGEMERCQVAHTDYYLRLSELAEPALLQFKQARWKELLDKEYANLRAALNFLLQRGDVKTALRMAIALQQFWILDGYLSEGRRFIEQGLAASHAGNILIPDNVRAKALSVIGRFMYLQNDPGQAILLFTESERLSRQQEDKSGTAFALLYQGIIAYNRGDIPAATAMYEESLRLYKEAGDQVGTAETLLVMGAQALYHGEYDRASAMCEESLDLFRKIGHAWAIAINLHYLGWTVYSQDDYTRACRLSEESVALFGTLGKPLFSVDALIVLAYSFTALGEEATAGELLQEALALGKELENRDDIGRAFCGLGHLALRQGNLARASTLYEKSIMTLKERSLVPRNKWVVASSLEGFGEIALAQGQTASAVRFLAAAETVRAAHGYYTPLGIESPFYERTLADVHNRLGEATITTLWAEGRNMTPEQALAAQSMSDAQLPTYKPAPPLTSYEGLTRREIDVLRLLAQGLTNSRIAQTLIISSSTVDTHIQSIYNKLGISSRSSATRFAIEHQLA